MLKDAAGNLWIGTDNGLSVYNGKKFTTFTSVPGIRSIAINDLVQDSKGVIWIATQQGIYYTKDEHIVPFASEVDAASRLRISSLVEDEAGNLLAGTDNGLYRFHKDNGNWQTEYFSTRNELPNNIITALSVRVDGGIWVCTYGGGVASFNKNAFFNFKKSEN